MCSNKDTMQPKINLKKRCWGFPGGAVVESLPANAGDTGSSPGLGRSHMPRSGWAREPQLLSMRVWSLCSATREAIAIRSLHTATKSSPRSPQLEKTHAQQQRPNAAKKRKKSTNDKCRRWCGEKGTLLRWDVN